jgi:hypothetical protein
MRTHLSDLHPNVQEDTCHPAKWDDESANRETHRIHILLETKLERFKSALQLSQIWEVRPNRLVVGVGSKSSSNHAMIWCHQSWLPNVASRPPNYAQVRAQLRHAPANVQSRASPTSTFSPTSWTRRAHENDLKSDCKLTACILIQDKAQIACRRRLPRCSLSTRRATNGVKLDILPTCRGV